MEYLQYITRFKRENFGTFKGFKPCYKWNTFNTKEIMNGFEKEVKRF